MKTTIFAAVITLGTMVSCGEAENTAAPKEVIHLGKAYGPVKVDTSKAVTVDEMLTTFNQKKKSMQFTFIAPIEEVCSKAGCWVNIDKGNGEMFMVRFKDHFTIPPKTKIGTKAFLHGTAYMDTVTVDLLRHFAEDAGKSKEEIEKITEPKYELGFEADGIVLIK
jgi:hypothetical protein